MFSKTIRVRKNCFPQKKGSKKVPRRKNNRPLPFIIAIDTCNIIRDVDVIVEFPPHDHHHVSESIASTEKVKPFYEALVGPPRHGRCWRARFTLVDGSSLNSINSYECYSEICTPLQWLTKGVGRFDFLY